LPEIGAGAALRGGGRLAADAAGLGQAARPLAQIGSSAVKAAAENAMMNGTDQVARMFAGDPNQSVESALTEVGLSGLLGGVAGGAIGSVSPLWKATAGPKVTQFLDLIQNKANGVDGIVPNELQSAFQRSGIEVPGEIKALFSDSPIAKEIGQNLMEAGTTSGTRARVSFDQFKENLSDSIINAFGKTPDHVEALENLSPFERGKAIQGRLKEELNNLIKPVQEEYSKFEKTFGKVDISPEIKSSIADKIGQTALEEGWDKAASDANLKLKDKVIEALNKQENANDLKKFLTNLREDNPFGSDTYRAAKLMSEHIKDGQEQALRNAVVKSFKESGMMAQPGSNINAEQLGENLIDKYDATRARYKDLRGHIDDLNERLHVGKYYGPDSFVKAMEEMDPETFARRLGDKNDAGLINLLNQKTPETANMVRDLHVDNLLKTAAGKARGEEGLNAKALVKAYKSLTPEMKDFVSQGMNKQKIDALSDIIEKIPDRKNPSGTAGTLDNLWKSAPNGALALVSALSGHGPMVSLISSTLGNTVLREGTDAIKLGLLKFLGSGQHISAEGFKGMVNVISNIAKGESRTVNAVKNIFKAGEAVIPQKLVPDEKKREMLKKRIDDLSQNQEKMGNIGGEASYYIPDHTQHMNFVAGTAIQYLQTLKPNTTPAGPLDSKPIPNSTQIAAYNKALDIAEQPLMVLNSVKNGTVNIQDIAALKTMYPSLYNNLSRKITETMTAHLAKGQSVPYQTRMGLSLFLGQPLDTTMTPQSLVSLQTPSSVVPPSQQQTVMHRGQMSKLGSKTNAMYLTRQESRETEHMKG
jgi:hypothetical protein